MRTTRHSLLAGVAVALTLGLAGTAFAASNPRALGVRINCQLRGVSSSGSRATSECNGLNGWFEGRLEWLSDGLVIFREDGPFIGLPGGAGEVQIFVDANNDERAFQRVYESTDPMAPSIFTAPDLTTRLYAKNLEGQFQLVSEQRYLPEASALWAVHSEDTAQINADLATERAARVASQKSLGTQLVAETTERQAAQIALSTGLSSEIASHKQDHSGLLSAVEQRLGSYTYSKSDIDSRVATLGGTMSSIDYPALGALPVTGGSIDSTGMQEAVKSALQVGRGLSLEEADSGKLKVTMQPEFRTGAAYDHRFIKQAARDGETKVESNLHVDGRITTNGPISIIRPDGSIKLGHGSSIIEAIGADPNIYPQAPKPSFMFSKDPQHVIAPNGQNCPTCNFVALRNEPQFTLLYASASADVSDVQLNPQQQVPTFKGDNTMPLVIDNSQLITVGVLASENVQLQAGPHVNGDTGEVRLAGACATPGACAPPFVGFKAPANPTPPGNQQGFLYTLPTAPGADGQTWVNDGAGTLSWTYLIHDVAGKLTDNTVTSIQRVPVAPPATSGYPSVAGQIFDFKGGQWQADSNMDLPGSATIAGTLGVTGNSTLANLAVLGNATLSGTLDVTQATTLNTLTVQSTSTLNGNATLNSNLTVNGNTTLNNTTTINGATTINNTLGVTGNSTFTGTLGVSGAATLGSNLVVNGASSLNGATQINNTLNVTGTTVLGSTLAVAGATTFSNNLNVQGTGTFNSISSGTGLFSGSVTVGSSFPPGPGGNLTVSGNGGSTGNGIFAGVITTSGAGTNQFAGGLGVGGGGSFGGNLTVASGHDLNVSGSLTTVQNAVVSAGTLAVGVSSNPTAFKAYVAGDIMADGGSLRVTGNQPLYFVNGDGGFYMTDSTTIKVWNDKDLFTNGTVTGGTVKGTSQLCIGPNADVGGTADCRPQWPTNAFNCNAKSTTIDDRHTCGDAAGFITATAGFDQIYRDFVPGIHASEHWYRITFENNSSVDGRSYYTAPTAAPTAPSGQNYTFNQGGAAGWNGNMSGDTRSNSSPVSGQLFQIYLDNGGTANSDVNYRFDVFSDCSGSRTWGNAQGGTEDICFEGGITDFIGSTLWQSSVNNGHCSFNRCSAGLTQTVYVRVRPVDENRDCTGYALHVTNN